MGFPGGAGVLVEALGVALLLTGAPLWAAAQDGGAPPATLSGDDRAASANRDDAAARVAMALPDPDVRELVRDALERSPGIAAAEARARAAIHSGPQADALPEPMIGLTGFVSPPETRVGPQRFTATLSQRLPWSGKISLREDVARYRSEALDAEVEARRLALVTDVRRLFHEIAFLDAQRRVVDTDRETLIHYEELARSRYASGVGIEQGVVKIQAEITRDDNRLLDIAARRAEMVATLNSLRDRPADAPIPPLDRASPSPVEPPPLEVLRDRALATRPELASVSAEISRANALIDLAQKEYKPDITLGLTWTAVSKRTDPAGMLQPPDGNGRDVFGINATFSLPIKRGKLEAGVEEAAEARLAAVEMKRDVAAMIDRTLGDLVERVRLSGQQVRLFERVLLIQAEQSLRSAEAGYASGGLNSLDLLDAERTLLEVRTGAARARADHAVALARLEGAIGGPLTTGTEGAER